MSSGTSEADNNPTVSMAQVFLTYAQCSKSKEQLQTWLQTLPLYQCSVVSHEEHEETGGDHLHAWVKFAKRKNIRMHALADLFRWDGHDANIALVKNTIADKQRVIGYVIKHGDYLVDNCDIDAMLGKKKERKYDTKRMLETPIQQLVEEGAISPHIVDKLYRCQQLWAILKAEHKNAKDVRGIWLYGPAGVGKTHVAREFAEKYGGLYIKAQNKWWDGYAAQPIVVLDDLDCDALCHYLKIWADKWACTGEMKGATIPLHHEYLIVTSNYTIAQIVSMKKDENFDNNLFEALRRRFRVLDWANYSNDQEHFECRNIEEALGIQHEEPKTPTTPECNATEITEPPTKKTPPTEPDTKTSNQEKALPMEPDLDVATPAIENDLGCMCGSGYGTFNGDLGDLPQLASEPEQEPEEESRDSLSEFCDTTSIDWEALHAAARNDPSYTMSGGCEEGASYSTSGEAEPSSGEDL